MHSVAGGPPSCKGLEDAHPRVRLAIFKRVEKMTDPALVDPELVAPLLTNRDNKLLGQLLGQVPGPVKLCEDSINRSLKAFTSAWGLHINPTCIATDSLTALICID